MMDIFDDFLFWLMHEIYAIHAGSLFILPICPKMTHFHVVHRQGV